jgi:hypothetical protein
VFLDERLTVAAVAGLLLVVGGSWLAAAQPARTGAADRGGTGELPPRRAETRPTSARRTARG